MISLVSPKYNFRDFCLGMFGKDPLQVIDAASAEITHARLIHQQKTEDRSFRRESRGRVYCDDLQQLISLFMGSAPHKVSREFLDAVNPLARHLLERWEILGFRQLLARQKEAMPEERAQKEDQLAGRNANSEGQYHELIVSETNVESMLPAILNDTAPFMHLVARRHEVEKCTIEPTLSVLQLLSSDPETALRHKNNVTLSFQGYEQDPRALFQIEEVRQFVESLNSKWCMWLFFMTKDVNISPLAAITLCSCRYKRSRAGRFRPVVTDSKGLFKHHFTALRFICKTCNLSDEQIESAVEEVIDYFMKVDFVSGCDTPQLEAIS
jgi:hypothetical protein